MDWLVVMTTDYPTQLSVLTTEEVKVVECKTCTVALLFVSHQANICHS